MSGTTSERLRSYLAALPPRAQSLLAREFERAIARGDNTAVATYVLSELRRVLRADETQVAPRADDPMRTVLRPLEPFLTDSLAPRPGTVRRSVLQQIWQWLVRDGAPLAAERMIIALTSSARAADRAFAISDFQRAAAVALSTASAAPADDQKALMARIGPAVSPEDLTLIADLLRAREALDALGTRLPQQVRELGPSQLNAVLAALQLPALQTKTLMPFALTLAMARMTMPWQIFRLATRAADSDSEYRVAATPWAVAVTMAIQYLATVAADLREDLKRARFDGVAEQMSVLHEGVRAIFAEIDIRQDSAWGRQLAVLRADISSALRAPLESLPGRTRRLLRQRASHDLTPASRLDATEAAECCALMQIVEVCRAYAEELAVNEISGRVHASLTQYVGPTADALIAALRNSDPRALPFRRQQAEAAIDFCAVLYGAEHAGRIRRSMEKALTDEPQAQSA